MKTGALVLLLLLGVTKAWAHRLDEYLQAVRVAVSSDRVDLSIDLTPGVTVVDRLLVLLDADRDGLISDDEQTAYVRRFLNELRLYCDEKPAGLRLVNASFPLMDAMKDGVGVIRIKATATIGKLPSGSHTVSLTNAHLPAISAYLVNALVPKDQAIELGSQERGASQRDYLLRFTVKPPR
jgi:hypothetical protein